MANGHVRAAVSLLFPDKMRSVFTGPTLEKLSLLQQQESKQASAEMSHTQV